MNLVFRVSRLSDGYGCVGRCPRCTLRAQLNVLNPQSIELICILFAVRVCTPDWPRERIPEHTQTRTRALSSFSERIVFKARALMLRTGSRGAAFARRKITLPLSIAPSQLSAPPITSPSSPSHPPRLSTSPMPSPAPRPPNLPLPPHSSLFQALVFHPSLFPPSSPPIPPSSYAVRRVIGTFICGSSTNCNFTRSVMLFLKERE